MRPYPLDLSSVPHPGRLSLPRANSSSLTLSAAPNLDEPLHPSSHSSSPQLPVTSSQTAPPQLPNSTVNLTSELNASISFPHQNPPLPELNPNSPFSPVSSTPSPWDYHQTTQNSFQDRSPSTHHVPQPLKIVPTSFRRSISAPFTTSGVVSLEFPPNIRLHSITEDGFAFPPSQPTPTFHVMSSLQSLPPFSSFNSSPHGLPFEASPTTRSLDPSGNHQPNPSDPQPNPISGNPTLNQSGPCKKWVANFYVWVYDSPNSDDAVPPPSPTTALSPSTASNLSNQLMGGLSKHFFHNSSKPSSLSLAKASAPKKDRRVKGLISGLTKQKDTSSLDSPVFSTFANDTHSFDSHSLSTNEQQLDSFTDKSETDSAELVKGNQNRFSSNSKNNELNLKPKRNSTPAETNKVGRKRFVPGFGGGAGAPSPSGPATSQLALGPGPAMNSHGIGAGQWRLVQGVITEDGQFKLYSTDDTLLYQIHLPSYRRTDIRMVHQSIFGRLHCGVITRRMGNPVHSDNPQNSPSVYNSTTYLPLQSSSSLPLTPTVASSQMTGSLTVSAVSNHPAAPSPKKLNETTNNSSSNPTSNPPYQQSTPLNNSHEVPIYVCMPNLILLESWLVICKCFCRPDDYRHLYPRSNKKNQTSSNKTTRDRLRSLTNNQANSSLCEQPSSPNTGGGDSGSIRGSVKQGLPERVRIWRAVEIELVEGRKLGEPHQKMVNNMLEVGNEAKAMMKEERRNSTGGYLPGSSQAALLSINKELLFNKSSNFAKHQTAQQFLINDPGYQQHQDHQPLQHRHKSKNNQDLNASLPMIPNKSSSATPGILPSLPNESLASHSKHQSSSSMNDNFYFVEFDWDREVVGRSTIKRNSNPFWKEEFKFSEIGSFKTLMVLNVYQIKKNLNHSTKTAHHSNSNSSSNYPSKIQLIGQTHLDFKKFKKNLPLQVWLPVYPYNHNNSNNSDENNQQFGDENVNSFDASNNNGILKKVEIIGEINLSITVFEQVVLAESEYSQMMSMLNKDNDIQLPLSLANMVLGDLDRLAELLIRIHESSNLLVLRLSQLAAIEINGDLSTASILFRANTLLTKMLEAFMRMVGAPFLELSIGSAVRRICTGKVELEIDPSKLKSSLSSSQKEKIIHENAKELNKLANEIWQSMYINRSKCPNRLRKIFVKIQEFVGNAYDDQDMRLTSISAFIFLRFFVPAILNPRLFNLIQFQPDSKSQRTLTLLAKTLQGLGNLTLFGIKEPWMSVMNEFITTHLDSFRDYISFISRESDSTKPEWTSKEFEGYGLPYALRASLPASCRDGIPSLPHLLDPVRDCSLLANLMVVVQRKSSGSDYKGGTQPSSVLPSNRPRRKTQVSESLPNLTVDTNEHSSIDQFLAICEELHAKSERRCLKIIQSESKGPTSNKISSIANPTATTTLNTSTTTSQGLQPTNSKQPTPESVPSNVINSRKCIIPNYHDKLSPPPPVLPATVTLTPPSHGSSPPCPSITRWKRSHTVSADHIPGSGSSSSSPRSPNNPPTNTHGSHNHHLVGGPDSAHLLASSTISPFSPSSGLKNSETTSFALPNRSPRSKTISSPNPFMGTERRAARRGLLSQLESPGTGQSVSSQDDRKNILNGENIQVATNENKSINYNDLNESSHTSFINSWEPDHLTFDHHDNDDRPTEIHNHLTKIRSLSRKNGFKLTGPNHFTEDLQSIHQQHPSASLEEKKKGHTNDPAENEAGVYAILSCQKLNTVKLNEKTSKKSFNNCGSNLDKGRRSSSSLSLSSLVSASSSSSFCSISQNLRKNLKLHNFSRESDSKHTSPIFPDDRLDYNSSIETTLQRTLPSPPSSSSPRSPDRPFLLSSYNQPPSSSGSHTATIFHKQRQPSSSTQPLRQEENSQFLSTQSNDGTLNNTIISINNPSSVLAAQNFPPAHQHHGNDVHPNFNYNDSSTCSSASSTSHNTGGMIDSPTASVTTNTTTTAFSISSVSCSSAENSHHHHRKGFIQKIMRKNSVARS